MVNFDNVLIELVHYILCSILLIWLLQGEVEFRSILYVPAVTPMGNDDMINPKTKNIRLYVKRVFISDDFDGELVNGIH